MIDTSSDDDHKPSRTKLMESLSSLEKEYSQTKLYLDQLLGVVVQHHPSLLNMLAQLQQDG